MAESYEVGIKMMMAGNVAEALAAMSGKLFGIHGQVKDIEKSMGAWKNIIGGAAAAFGGFALGKGIVDIANHGKELLHQQNMLLRNGIAYNDILALTAKAYSDISKAVPTASSVDVLRVANELISVKGSLASAALALPQSLKIEALIGNATGKSAEGQGYDMWRSVEDKGVIQDKAKTDQMLGLMAQAVIATGGKIGGNDFFSYSRKALASWMGDSAESFPLQVMEMQTLGAPTAGTQRRMFGRMIEGGQKLSKKQIAAWSGIDMFHNGGIDGKEIESHDPQKFIPMVIDNLEKKGIVGFEKTKLWAQTALNASSAAYFLTAYSGMTEKDENGKSRLDKEAANLRRAMGLDEGYGAMIGGPQVGNSPRGIQDPAQAAANAKNSIDASKADYTAVMSAFTAQWKSMMEAIGGPAAKALIPVMKQLTGAFTSIGDWANANQGVAKTIFEYAGALAATTTLVGGAIAGKGLFSLLSGSGLNASAAALTSSAIALDGAAVALGGKSSIPGLAGGAAAGAAGGMSFLSRLRMMAGPLGALIGIQTILDAQDGDILDQSARRNDAEREFPDRGFHHSKFRSYAYPQAGNALKRGFDAAFGANDEDRATRASNMKFELPPQRLDVKFVPAPVILDGRVVGQILGKLFASQSSANGGSSIHDSGAAPTWHGAH